MTLTTTIDRRTVIGNLRMVMGHCTSDGAGGDIDTGLRRVESFIIQMQGNAVAENAPTVDETLPLASGTVSVVTDASDSFNWIAYGR